MKDFFVSYTSADSQWAEWIAWQLEEAKFTVVIQAWDFRPGGNFVLDMQQAAAECERTIAVLSPDYLKSLYAQPEWAAAFAQDPTGTKKLLLPVRVRECDLKGLLPQIAYIDLVGATEDEEAKDRLLKGVNRERAKPATPPSFPTTKTEGRTVADKPPFPGALPPLWNIGRQPNPHFVGREELLTDISQTLKAGQLAALHGLGGIGKTQLAVEYAYRYAADYDVVWYIRAEDEVTLMSDVAALAGPLGLPEAGEREIPVIVAAVLHALNARDGWLLIFDNVPEYAAVRKWLPQNRAGHLLLTSRDAGNWGNQVRKLEIKTLPPDVAAHFLQERVGQATTSGNDELAAQALAAELGYLPLALEQAAAYTEATQETLAGYLELFRTRRRELWEYERPPADYPATVATTWLIAFIAVEAKSEAAAELMRLCAYLGPDDIPLELLSFRANHLPEMLAECLANRLLLNQAVAALRRYSLVDRQKDRLNIHRLVQTVTRDRLTAAEQQQWATRAVNVVNDVFPDDSNDVSTWSECEHLLSHAQAAADQGKVLQIATRETSRLFNQIGAYFLGRAQYIAAVQSFERALHVIEAAVDPPAFEVAAILNNLGSVLQEIGKPDDALRYYERALLIIENTFGNNHPEVATVINNIGEVFRKLGRLEEACQYYNRALSIDEVALGTNHPNVARDISNLGLALKALGQLNKARQCYKRALHIDELAFGPKHHNVAIRLTNLGCVLQELGKLGDAQRCFERARRIDEAVFGSDHPNVARDNNNLGHLLRALGKFDQAHQCFERVLSIDEAIFGPVHLDVAKDLNNLSLVLYEIGKFGEAVQCGERSLHICISLLGAGHPKTILVQKNLASLKRK